VVCLAVLLHLAELYVNFDSKVIDGYAQVTATASPTCRPDSI
jgi:hypothetical protein